MYCTFVCALCTSELALGATGRDAQARAYKGALKMRILTRTLYLVDFSFRQMIYRPISKGSFSKAGHCPYQMRRDGFEAF